ncbi:MAG: hypothetical protein QOH92_1018, partial [Chloroflexota bacterium]|nr:hypothetical protein [Chloroflexota bacterium]
RRGVNEGGMLRAIPGETVQEIT